MCGTFLLRSVAWLLLLKRRRSWCKDQTLPRKSTSTAFGQLGTAREDHRLAVMGGCVVMWAGWSTSTAPCSRLRPSWTSRPVRAWQPITTEMRDAQQTDRRSLGAALLHCFGLPVLDSPSWLWGRCLATLWQVRSLTGPAETADGPWHAPYTHPTPHTHSHPLPLATTTLVGFVRNRARHTRPRPRPCPRLVAVSLSRCLLR